MTIQSNISKVLLSQTWFLAWVGTAVWFLFIHLEDKCLLLREATVDISKQPSNTPTPWTILLSLSHVWLSSRKSYFSPSSCSRMEACQCSWEGTHITLLLSYVRLWDPVDCSLPGSSVHGISQARMLEPVAISYSRGSSWSRDGTQASCIGRWILYHWGSRETDGDLCCRTISPEVVCTRMFIIML